MLVQVIFAERDALHRGGMRTADEFGEAVEPEPTHEVWEQSESGAVGE